MFKEEIKKAGRTKIWIADQIGISNVLLSYYLNGTRPMPDHIKKKIKEVLNVHVVSNWISVEENLPPKYEDVIIRNENNIITTDQIGDNGWVFEGVVKVKVTHWQRLPDPPY